jgi:hypothetical protein
MENHRIVGRDAALDSRGQTALKWQLKLNEQNQGKYAWPIK